MAENEPDKPERKLRTQQIEWLIYVGAALIGVGYVGPYLGKLTGYYEGFFSLGLVLAALGLVQAYKKLTIKKSGDIDVGE